MIDSTSPEELSSYDKLIAGSSMLGGGFGLLVALYVGLASRLQYRVASQYLTFEGTTIVITAGYYFRLLAIIYFVIAVGAIAGGFLMFTSSYTGVGQYLLLEIYTIGVIRALFALVSEGRYYALGQVFMLLLALFGLAILVMLSKPDRFRKHTLVFGSQIILFAIFFIVVPIHIMDPVPSVFFND